MTFAAWKERLGPHVLALVIVTVYGAVSWKQTGQIYVPARSAELLGTGITVSGVAVAFIATIQGILLSMTGHAVIQRLKELRVYSVLLSYFTCAINWCMFFILLSVAAYFAEWQNPNTLQRWLFLFWLLVGLIGTGTCFRITRLFSKILHE